MSDFLKNIKTEEFDAVVVGAGGAGLRASLMLAKAGYKTGVISKVYPTRSHTGSAQGGMNAALANVLPDDWKWHMYDTIKGSDWLGDQDAIEFMCMRAPEVVVELEHIGVPFSRLDDGNIYQRKFGGQSQNYGGEQAARTCAAADRTGHAILHGLYQQNLKEGANFFDEYFAIDLIKDDEGKMAGILVMKMSDGELLAIHSKVVMLATGGAGQIYKTNSNATANTGDGMALALRAGAPLEDMEFIQFHPTGVAGAGRLLSESARGEGGILRNDSGEAFMARYAPSVKDLASRDVVARAIYLEVQEGRGCGPDKDHVMLDLTHLGRELIESRLPAIREMALEFAGVDMVEAPVPIYPTCHYMMGGVATNIDGEVIGVPNDANKRMDGFYAMGECACVSVHGANRLGGNSLLDIVVFGQAAGESALKYLAGEPQIADLTDEMIARAASRVRRLVESEKTDSGEGVYALKNELQRQMEKYAGVFRRQDIMEEGIEVIRDIRNRIYQNTYVEDKSKTFNTALFEALELENLADVALSVMTGALLRQESRGAHSRVDFTERDDEAWMKHTLFYLDGEQVEYKPVNMSPKHSDVIPPKKRVY